MRIITVNDKMQSNYSYHCIVAIGEEFHAEFKSELTPAEMLALGVFGGKYLTDCLGEFPGNWFIDAKLSLEFKDISLNYFSADAS